MKTILILGAGSLHVDTIETVKEAGFYVICVDRNPQAPSRRLAHVFEHVDIRDVNGLLKVARRYKIDGLMPINEFGIIPASKVAASLGLPGLSLEVARNCTNKKLMRGLWKDAGIRQPDHYVVKSAADAINAGLSLGYPFIMKPPSNCASRGVLLVSRPEQVKGYFDKVVRFSEHDEVIAEGFLEGEEYSVEAIVHGKRVRILAIALKEIVPKFPYRITCALNYGITLTNASRRELETQLQSAVDALGLENWLVHSEFVLTGRGWEIIELGARGGGGYIFGSIVEYVSGYPYASAFANRVTGTDFPDAKSLLNRGSSCRFVMPPPGVLTSISGLDEARSLPYVHRVEVWIKESDIVPEVTDGSKRPGCIVTRAPHFETAMLTGIQARDTINFSVEEAL